jgi:hypothetical protein
LEFKTKINRSFLDNAWRNLIITKDYILFEDKDLANDSHTQFNKSDITAYRYGVKWIRGAKFTIGRDYQIYIQNIEGRIIKINIKSFYGINKVTNYKNYVDIIDSLWDLLFKDMATDFIARHKNGESFNIGSVKFTNDHLTIEKNTLLKKKEMSIPWEKMRIKDYRTYLAVFSSENPSEINQCYNYKDDWNTTIIYSVLHSILQQKGIAS